MAGQKKYSLREAVNTEATTDIRALFYTTIRIQDGDGRGVNIWGRRGFLRAMPLVHWYISNRLDGCV